MSSPNIGLMKFGPWKELTKAQAAAAPDEHVLTVVEGDDGDEWVACAGFHFVNVLLSSAPPCRCLLTSSLRTFGWMNRVILSLETSDDGKRQVGEAAVVTFARATLPASLASVPSGRSFADLTARASLTSSGPRRSKAEPAAVAVETSTSVSEGGLAVGLRSGRASSP